MKNGFIFLLLPMLWVISCTNNVDQNGLLVLKPGHFCKVGSIVVENGTIYLCGSFIEQDNPNTTAPLRHSYIASIDTSGKLNWEQYNDSPDYIHWDKLISSNRDILYALGTKSSPLSSQLVTLASLEHYDPKRYSDTTFIDTLPNTIAEAHAKPNGHLAFTTLAINPATGYSCLKYKQTEPICRQGALNCIKPIEDDKYLSAWGTQSQTERLSYIADSNVPETILVPDSLNGILVNSINNSAPNNYLLATTIKNGQGPCIYHLDENSNFTQQLCLSYWPMNGSVLMKVLGDCIVMAFNATDDLNGNYVQLAIVNSSYEVVFEEAVTAPSRFVLSDMTIDHAHIYLVGTLETNGEGSSMAIKIIPVTANAVCTLSN